MKNQSEIHNLIWRFLGALVVGRISYTLMIQLGFDNYGTVFCVLVAICIGLLILFYRTE